MAAPIRPTADQLLAQEDFLRGLVRGLLRDEHEVDDVVQQTWLEALTSPPNQPKSLRGWLAIVARNLARRQRRSEARVERREKAAAKEEMLPATEAIVERLELQQILVDAVLRLKEPYRTAVLLRYFDSLPASEVAERMGVSAGTIHTRLHRALARLRARLDASRGGDRRAWSLALLPLAATRPGAVAVTTNGTAAAAGGAALMAMKTQWIAALVAVAIGAAAWWSWPDLEEIEPSEVTAVQAPELGALAAELVDPMAQEGAIATPGVQQGEASIKGVPERTGSLLLTATWEQDGSPAAGLWFELMKKAGSMAQADEEGRLRWEELEPGRVTIRPLRGGSVKAVEIGAGEAAHVEMTLPLGIDVVGEVVDVQGKPIPNAEVRVSLGGDPWSAATEAVTDEQGRFEIPSVHRRRLHAWKEGWQPSRVAWIAGSPGTQRRVRLVLDQPGGQVGGRVIDMAGEPVAGACVRSGLVGDVADEEGRFLVRGIYSGGENHLDVSTEDGEWRFPVAAGVGEIVCQVDPAATATLAGVVRWEDSTPARGCLVRLLDGSDDWTAIRTDEQGRFEMRGVRPGIFKISVGGALRVLRTVELTAGEVTEWECNLGPRVELFPIEGRIIDGKDRPLSNWYARIEGADYSVTLQADSRGHFRHEGFPDREYSITAHAGDGVLGGGRELARVRAHRPLDGPVTLRIPTQMIPSAYLVGRLAAEDPELLRSVSVLVSDDADGGGELPAIVQDGVFRVGPLAPGSYTLRTQPSGGSIVSRARYHLEADETLDVGVVWLDEPGTISGLFETPNGERLVVREVRATMKGEVLRLDRIMHAAIEGNGFQLGPLAEATWELTARVHGYPLIHLGSHEIVAGEHIDLGTIPLGSPETLEIVPNGSWPSVSASFEILARGRGLQYGWLGGTGKTVELWPGSYVLVVRADGMADFEQEVEIRPGEATRVEVPWEPGSGCLLVFTESSSGTSTRGHASIRERSGKARVLMDEGFQIAGALLPDVGADLPAGSWEIEVTSTDGREYTATVPTDGPTIADFERVRKPLSVSILDGIRLLRSGTVITGGRLAPTWFVQLAPGSYRVIVKDGAERIERRISVPASTSPPRRLIEVSIR